MWKSSASLPLPTICTYSACGPNACIACTNPNSNRVWCWPRNTRMFQSPGFNAPRLLGCTFSKSTSRYWRGMAGSFLRDPAESRPSELQRAVVHDRLAIQRDRAARQRHGITVRHRVVAAGPCVVADADGDGARGHPVARGGVLRELDVRIDAEVDEAEVVLAVVVDGVVRGLEIGIARAAAFHRGHLAVLEGHGQVVDLLAAEVRA